MSASKTIPAKSASGEGEAGRHAVPTILQLEAAECGAASLAMILAGFRRWAPLDEVRSACGVSRDGSKAVNILKAGRAYGLVAKGWRYNSVNSLRALAKPAIVFVNMNHFLVLEGFQGERVHLNDPAMGRRRVTVAEFQAMFSGIAITLQPGPDFKPGGRREGVIGTLWGWLKGGYDGFHLVSIAGLFLIIPSLVAPSFLQVFTDHYLINGQEHWIGWMLLIMLAAVILQAVLSWLNGYYVARLKTTITLRSGAKFVYKMLRLPITFYAQRYPGSISNRVERTGDLSTLAAAEFGGLLVTAARMLLCAGLMIGYSLELSLITFAFAFCVLSSFLLTQKFIEESGQRIALFSNKVAATTMHGVSMMESLKAAGTESNFFSRWAGQVTLLVNEGQRLGRISAKLTVLPTFMTSFSTVAVLGVGGVLVMQGAITIGILVAFQMLQGLFMSAVSELVTTATRFKDARGVLDQLHDVLDTRQAPEFERKADETRMDASALGRFGRLDGRVSVRGLKFGYSVMEPPLLDGFDIDIEPGAWVALVGGSGSGKSTVGRLVNGLFEPWSGVITYDGRPIHSVPRSLLRDSVAVVDQDIVLFEGTIRDNLTLWDETVPESAIIEAARDAEIHDDIVSRPGGYDARIAEHGGNFSGGQRQRLEIARALVNKPSILVLDEATSALDPGVEMRIIANLRRRGCTCLVIAHRLSTIRDCDEIVVMDRGKVIERGTHEFLMARNGPYHRLLQT